MEKKGKERERKGKMAKKAEVKKQYFQTDSKVHCIGAYPLN